MHKKHNGLRASFYYYRDTDQKEIDLLIVQDGAVYPLGFKKTALLGKGTVRHFAVLEKLGMPIGLFHMRSEYCVSSRIMQ